MLPSAAKALGQSSFEGTSALEDLFSKLSLAGSGSQRGEESQVQGSADFSGTFPGLEKYRDAQGIRICRSAW